MSSAKPVAWWVPAWLEPLVSRSEKKPMLWPEAQPLYDQAALDAAVAEERERCHTHAARVLDSATEGEWAAAAMHLLAVCKGDAA